MNKPLECKKCGYTWDKRIKEPKACPSCKSYNWKGK